jgi:hypothetical protein
MQFTTVKKAFLALILASALPLAACGDDDSPTSPTQSGPPVAETPPPAPAPPELPPTPPAPVPPSPPPSPPTDAIVTVTGPIANLTRSGEGGLDVSFRIDDFTIVRASGSTPVIVGSATSNTSALLEGQTVTVEGRRTNGFLDAARVTIASQ